MWSSLARTSGGGWTFAKGLTQALVDSTELDVTIVLPKGLDTRELLQDRPCKVISVRPMVGPAKIVRDLWMINLWARNAKANVVLVPHEWASWAGGSLVINVIQNILFLHPAGRRLHPVKSILMRAIAKLSAPFVGATIAVSDEARMLWRDETGLDAVVVPEGIAGEFARTGAAPRDNAVVIMTGNHPHKNPGLARAVADALIADEPSMRLTVVGIEGPADGRAVFIEELSNESLATLFSRTQVVVLTSAVESFGLPAFEAHASGCSVVVLAGTAMSEWLGKDPMVSVVAPESEALVVAVRRARTFSDNFRIKSDRHSWDTQGPKWVRAILTIASETSERGPRRWRN